MKKIALLFIAGTFFSTGYAQTKLLETVTKQGNEIVIPYKKFQLSNGLTLIVHEDHSDPIVHVDVTYHVGSAREEVGKSGFAHFFEHMMFQGSDHVADEEHFKIVSESGGTLNGTTNLDRTNYFETMPSNQLETALWLEADRMGFLLDAVTQQKFEVQRATVKNERGQRYDNAPYGLIFEKLSGSLYPYGHPYSWPTIGFIEDLNRVDVNDLKRFFLRWYGPNNATVTVGGDVNTDDVVKLVEKYFGSIPAGPAVVNADKAPGSLEADRYLSYEDNNIRFPALLFAFPTVEDSHPDKAALDCLAEIIGVGKSSFFYKNFVLTQKAIQAAVFNNNNELAGSMIFFVLPFPGQNLSGIDSMMRASILEFEKTGVTDDAIAKFKAQYEASEINSLQSVAGKVSKLAAYQTFYNNPNQIKKELSAYASVSKEDVIRVYNQYIKGKPAVVLSVYPKGKPEIVAKEDNYQIPTSGKTRPLEDYSQLAYNKAKDNFDRSKRPATGPNPVVSVPEFYQTTLGNGLKVIGTRNSEVPTVTMQITLDGAHRLEAKNPAMAGITELMVAMMNEATENYTAEAFDNELDKLGSSVDISSNDENVVITIQSLVKNLDATVTLAMEKMFKPKFAEEDYKRIKKQQKEGIEDQETKPVTMADNVYARLIYGDKHIMSIPTSGTVETMKNIKLDSIVNYYKNYFSPSNAKLVIVGDIDEKTAMAKAKMFESWKAKPYSIPTQTAAAPIAKTTVYLVNKDKAPQSEIRIGYKTDLKYDATGEFYKTTLMNYILGGAFNSRINLNLREDKGWTYGARSYFVGSTYPGYFEASAGVKASATDSAVEEFMKEIIKYRQNGITDDELKFTKSSIGQRDALKYETGGQKAGFLRQIITYNLSKDFVKKQTEILNATTKEEINALAKKHLKADNMYIVVVGDASSVRPGLARLGYPIVEVDSKGNPVNLSQEEIKKD
jgi:zinc protease